MLTTPYSLSGRMPASNGKAAIRAVYKEMVADPALAVKFEASRIDVAISSDLAFAQGSYTATETDPNTKNPRAEKGSYTDVYKKQPGWLMEGRLRLGKPGRTASGACDEVAIDLERPLIQ